MQIFVPPTPPSCLAISRSLLWSPEVRVLLLAVKAGVRFLPAN